MFKAFILVILLINAVVKKITTLLHIYLSIISHGLTFYIFISSTKIK